MIHTLRKTAVLVAAATVLAVAAPDPVGMVRAKDTELRALLKQQKKAATPERREKIKTLINSVFDFQELGRRALPSQTWKSATPEQQNAFVTEFRRMVENSSVKQLDSYESDSSSYQPAKITGDKCEVTVNMWNKGTMSVVVYKMKQENGQWRAWDFVIDDLSTMRNYRDQFSKILKEKDLDGLIETIRKKADEP